MLYISLVLLSAALFGAAVPLSKALLTSIGPFQLAGLLYIGAAIGTATRAFNKGQTQPWSMDKKNIIRLTGAILCGGVMAPLFLLLGLKATSASSVSLLLPLELVATALIGWLLFRDHLGTFGWLGMLGVVAASVLLSFNGETAGIKAGLLIMVACLCWGFDNNFISLIDGITPAQTTFWKGLMAGIINLSIGSLTQNSHIAVYPLFCALGVGIFSYGASIVFYITAAQNIGAARGQMFFASSPFFGVILSYIFLGETATSIQVVAAALLIGSLGLVFRDRHEHSHLHEQLEHAHAHSHDDEHHGHNHPERKISDRHAHWHRHEPVSHLHKHWPDLHHRHNH